MDNLDSPSKRIDAEIASQKEKVAGLALACAFVTISSAAWYMWPALNNEGIPVFDRLGPVGLLLAAALLLQDLVESDARARGRLGAAGSLTWPAIAVFGVGFLSTEGTVQIGHFLMFFVAAGCLFLSRQYLAFQS